MKPTEGKEINMKNKQDNTVVPKSSVEHEYTDEEIQPLADALVEYKNKQVTENLERISRGEL